jgi:hypothetical protein
MLIIAVAAYSALHASDHPNSKFLTISFASLFSTIVAAPATVGGEGFALPGPYWVQLLFGKKPSFWIGSFFESWAVFTVLACLIYVVIRIIKIIKSKNLTHHSSGTPNGAP